MYLFSCSEAQVHDKHVATLFCCQTYSNQSASSKNMQLVFLWFWYNLRTKLSRWWQWTPFVQNLAKDLFGHWENSKKMFFILVNIESYVSFSRFCCTINLIRKKCTASVPWCSFVNRNEMCRKMSAFSLEQNTLKMEKEVNVCSLMCGEMPTFTGSARGNKYPAWVHFWVLEPLDLNIFIEAVGFRVPRKGTGFPRYWVPFPITLVKKTRFSEGHPVSKENLTMINMPFQKCFSLINFFIDISGLKLVQKSTLA